MFSSLVSSNPTKYGILLPDQEANSRYCNCLLIILIVKHFPKGKSLLLLKSKWGILCLCRIFSLLQIFIWNIVILLLIFITHNSVTAQLYQSFLKVLMRNLVRSLHIFSLPGQSPEELMHYPPPHWCIFTLYLCQNFHIF